MKCELCGGPMSEQEGTYTLEMNGKLAIVEHVPAKLCKQCGERLYAPSTVERLQKTIWESKRPTRVVQTPVFAYSE